MKTVHHYVIECSQDIEPLSVSLHPIYKSFTYK